MPGVACTIRLPVCSASRIENPEAGECRVAGCTVKGSSDVVIRWEVSCNHSVCSFFGTTTALTARVLTPRESSRWSRIRSHASRHKFGENRDAQALRCSAFAREATRIFRFSGRSALANVLTISTRTKYFLVLSTHSSRNLPRFSGKRSRYSAIRGTISPKRVDPDARMKRMNACERQREKLIIYLFVSLMFRFTIVSISWTYSSRKRGADEA